MPPCPVCRAPIEGFDFKRLLATPVNENTAPSADQLQYTPDLTQWRQKQKDLQQLFDKQKEKGGIIDPEEELKRLLIDENTVGRHSRISTKISSNDCFSVRAGREPHQHRAAARI